MLDAASWKDIVADLKWGALTGGELVHHALVIVLKARSPTDSLLVPGFAAVSAAKRTFA
jgi:hypothetical protein